MGTGLLIFVIAFPLSILLFFTFLKVKHYKEKKEDHDNFHKWD